MLSTDIIAMSFGGDKVAPSAHTAVLARIELYDDIAAAIPVWQRLVERDALATPYGRIDWIETWHSHARASHAETPLIAVGRDGADEPLFLLPLTVSRYGALTVARYFGGAHSQINLGLWRRDAATAWRPEMLKAALADIAAQRGIDLFVLFNQPLIWQGLDTPLALLPHQPSPDNAYSASWPQSGGDAALQTAISAGNRKRLRGKERKLQALDGYRYVRAASATDVERILAAFKEQKRRYFAVNGIHNPFEDPGMAEFLRASCLRGLDSGHPVIELHALEAGGRVLAVIGGTSDGKRLSAMFNSIIDDEEMARLSPGLVLMSHLIRSCADRGATSYDHGVGYAPYKLQFCKQVDELFDSFLGFTARGRIAAAAYRSGFAVKRAVKTTAPVWTAMLALRRLCGRLRRN